MGIHAVLAGILTMCGLYTINLIVMGSSPNISLINVPTIFKAAESLGLSKEAARLVIAIAAAAVCLVLLILFRTHLGLCIRATGDNEAMVSASSINVDAMKITALAFSNALVAVSGGLIAQYQGFADVNSGSGMLVVGLASVIIGEVIVGKRGLEIGFFLDFRFDHLPLYHRSGNQEPDFSGICVKTGISVHRSSGAGASGDPLSDGAFKDEADERKRYV